MHKTVNTLIDQLKSHGVKERQAAIASLRAALNRDGVVAELDNTSKRLGWLALFQALFTAVLNEKSSATHGSKSAPAAKKRVAEAASAVRWLTERSVYQLTHKNVIKALLNHLVQTSSHQGNLFLPIALDYAKSIRCVLDYPPHLEHIDDEMWVKLAEMCLNVILGDSLRKKLAQEVEDETEEIGRTDLTLEDSEDEDDVTTTSAETKKRRRREGSGTPGPSTVTRSAVPRSQPVSVEQIEFGSLLALLFTSSSPPFYAIEYPDLGSAILNRLLRFLRLYPTDTSLHPDFIVTLSATLSHLALNKRDAVTRFARASWDALLGIWGTKNKKMKENLIIVLRTLFPFYTTRYPEAGSSSLDFSYVDGVSRLWHLLDGEAENRWGVDGLSLDSLRFSLIGNRPPGTGKTGAFIARTFQYGLGFDANQAVSWTILELQADCAEKLHTLSETFHSHPPTLAKRGGKRAKFESPVVSMLDAIQLKSSPVVRSYHLQILLFFIDRHWAVLHEILQQSIHSHLLQLVSCDDALVQSWAFLCLAAIAESQVSSGIAITPPSTMPQTWDPIWTHAIRRADVPIVSRSACHVAYILLLYAKQLLTSQRVLLEIEAFAKDMDVQGPPYPYDSVCAFVALCLQVANQDMRLYRMRVEDKVLGWVADCYSLHAARDLRGNPRSGKLRTSRPLASDVTLVLTSACGLQRRTSLPCRMLLPESVVVSSVKEDHQTFVIRDFLLRARLPVFIPSSTEPLSPNSLSSVLTTVATGNDLVSPGPRERKVSSILLKVLEDTETMDNKSPPSAEQARSIVDFSIVALSFEGLLALNGKLPNQRVLHAACKAAASVAQLFTRNNWTLEEKALVLLGFDPLVHVAEDDDTDPWIGLLSPHLETGIRREVLDHLINVNLDDERTRSSMSRELQKVIWQIPEVSDFLTQVMTAMKTTLRVILARISRRSLSSDGIEADDQDDFGLTGGTITVAPIEAQRHSSGRVHVESVLDVCMSFLAMGPILQSSGEEPTRDRELTDIVLNCDGDEFLLASKAYLVNVRRRALNINLATLDNLLVKLASLSTQYIYQLNDELKLMIIRLLDSTAHLWTQPDFVGFDTVDKVRGFFQWLLDLVRVTKDEDGKRTKSKVRSWRVRDAFVAFLARYMALDPFERIWTTRSPSIDAGDADSSDGHPPNLPSHTLPTINQDDDIRVRFRSAYVNASLFNHSRFNNNHPMVHYREVHASLCTNVEMYEHMLTRILSLGNIMVVSSAVRRGAYWHILEASYHSDKYNPHILAVFRGVSNRLGLIAPSKLFEVHVSQIAYSIFMAGLDFLRCPPEVLGYEDRKACAESALHAFAPIYILMGGSDSETIARGCRSFANHCQAAQISIADGYRDCFAVFVGYELVSNVDKIVSESPSLIDWRFTHVDKSWLGETSFEDQMSNDIDSIVVVVLRTLGDQECQSILAELGGQSQREGRVFRALTVCRTNGDRKTHEANLPSYGVGTVLRALGWLSNHVPDTDSASTTYHVIQQLLTNIQESPLVNEQLRYMNALCLWVSCHSQHFRDSVLLHTLIHGVASLLEQIDLALATKSILEWALSQYAKVTEKDSRLANVLIRLCCVANEHASSKSPVIAKIGEELLRWLEGQMLQLAKFPYVKSQVTKAIPAWPREPPPELESLCRDVSAHTLSSVLSDLRIASNKFTLVRRLCNMSSSGDYSQEQFSRMDIWRLKDCIPSSRQLQTADIDAFASLLILNKGQIHSFGLNPLSGQVPKHQQARTPRGKACADDSSLVAERSILELLLAMLDSDLPSKVHTAYRVLRTLPPEIFSDTESWTTEHSTVLRYFRGRSRRSPARPPALLRVLVSDVYVNMAQEFKAWITTFATLLCDVLAGRSSFYSRLPPILQTDSDFAEQVMPILVQILLSTSVGDPTTNETPRVILSQFLSRVLNSTTSDVSSLRAVVNIVLHLRHSQPPKPNDELAYDKWLDLDFMLLSKSAILSGAYTTALLFHELALEYSATDVSLPSSADAENILFEIYSHIEEPDGFYGIKTQDLHHFLLKRFHHEHQWEKAFKFHGAALEARSQGGVDTKGVLHSLYSFGFDTLALSVQQNVFDASNYDLGVNSSNMVYHLGWRTETWDLPDQASSSGSGTALYNSLRAVSRERDPQAVDTIVRKALMDEMERFRALGDEDLVGIREVARNVMCLSQVNSLRIDLQECLKSGMLDSALWSKFVEIDGNFDFHVLEDIVATRISLLRSARHKEQRQQVGTTLTPFISGLMDIEKQCLTRISEAARVSHNLQIALNSVIRAQKLERSPTALVSQEFANVLWDQKEHKVAVQFLKDLIRLHFPDIKSETTRDHTQKALLLARLGSWTSEACLEKPMDIWTHYFRPAASLVTELIATVDRPKASIATVYHQCAVFADRQYHTILRSPDAIKWKLYAERKEKEIQQRKEQMLRTQSGSKAFNDLKHDQERAEKLHREDTQRYRKHSESLSTFLEQAIDMYSRCLQAADDFDNDGHIRLVSLWFSNFNDNDLQDKVRLSIDRIPSRKFVFLSHQLSARLAKPANDPITGSQDTLQNLILRMCREHPFHSLYQVYCLRPSPGTYAGRRSSARLDLPVPQGERAAAAVDIFDRLRADPSSNRQVIDVEQVCDAYLQWAKRPIKGTIDKSRGRPYDISSEMLILKLNDVRVPVLTVNTPIDPTLQYQNCIWISHYEKTFEPAGGVNLPKICYCRGSDGAKYKQLFKGEGNDDLRQDAVMEQVFDLVNVVLSRDRETRRRNLSIRGYKVIPLAPQAGVLEFVGNTLTLEAWVPKAHLKYNKGDISYQEFFGKMFKMREENKGSPTLTNKLITLFLSLRERFKPVMRHFFTEKHKVPMSWFAMRLNYTRSVATTSIVGHILGLGDRHTSNILLDSSTGEVVHIDLGIAFEQGKLLPIPESVPFRMTADIVDGMGTTGTQGVFQRCAEETLRVLRSDSEVVLTVLEVFKYDPLHSWTASEFKIKRAQASSTTTDPAASRALTPGFGGAPELDMSSGTADEAADRALTTVARKLDRALSTEYTVNDLIAEATDPANLACMFIGWKPHL